MPQSESNRIDLRLSLETAWAETPAAPTMASLPYTSENLIYEKRTVKSSIVRADRLTDDVVEVGAGSSGDINFEYKFTDFESQMLAALGQQAWTSATKTGAGTAANIDFAVSGGGNQVITGQSGDWTNFTVGAYVRVSGANANNNGVFRIFAKTATTLTVNNATGTSQTSSTANVLQKMARTGTYKHSFLFEKSFPDITQFVTHRGMRVATWALNVEAEQIITGSFGYMGERAVRAGATVSGSVTAASALSIVSATANMGRLEEAGVALTTKIRKIHFNLSTNARSLTAVANKFPIGINMGSFEITGSLEAYFEDAAMLDKLINHSTTSLVFEFTSAEDDRTIITIPKLKFTSGWPVGAGLNQDTMLSLNFTAINDSVSSSMMQVDVLT